MKIKQTYKITPEVFTEVYRTHCHIKFHIRRSMYLSIGLFLFGMVMEKGYGKDFGWINSVVVVLVIVSVLCNLLCDFVLPKSAYKALCAQKADTGVITIQDDGLIFGEGQMSIRKTWDQYEVCVETKSAFLLYQKDLFTMILKETCEQHVEEVRSLLQNKVNKGKNIPYKK